MNEDGTPDLLLNRWRTPDGTILISHHRNDYVSHNDENGKTYAIDGGTAYCRKIGDAWELVDLCLYSDSPHEELREHVCWGSYGKQGKSKFQRVKIKDMSDEHLLAVMETQSISDAMRKLMEDELNHRKETR